MIGEDLVSVFCKLFIFTVIWDIVCKNGPSKLFKGCLPQISLGPFLNTLPHMLQVFSVKT